MVYTLILNNLEGINKLKIIVMNGKNMEHVIQVMFHKISFFLQLQVWHKNIITIKY